MLTAAIILYAEKWKGVKEWMETVMESVKLAKPTILIKEKNLPSFVSIWKPLPDFMLGTEGKK